MTLRQCFYRLVSVGALENADPDYHRLSRILTDHNAHIRVEDNHPAGARFIIEIPALAASETEANPAEVRA